MVTYQGFAKDLRALAAMLDRAALDLPMPQYADQGLAIDIHVAEERDVLSAVGALNTQVSRRNGHTTTQADIGTVHLRFVHVTDTAMAAHTAKMAYAARMAYAATMPVSA